MKIEKAETIAINGLDNRKITLDICYPSKKGTYPVVLFCHGFKGFKDWGHFNWVSQKISEQGFVFVKFNYSFNGTSPENYNDVNDLKAFSENNYTKEIDDVRLVLNYIEKSKEDYPINDQEIYIIGHSRGGGIAFLSALNDKRIKKAVLWATLSNFESFFRKETIQQWEKEGVVFAENKRTGQMLPIKKQFYDDFILNKSVLDIPILAKLFDKPLLLIHGDKDESVDISHSEYLYNEIHHSILIKVENANHTFGATHPFDESKDVTEMLEELVENTYEFLKE